MDEKGRETSGVMQGGADPAESTSGSERARVSGSAGLPVSAPGGQNPDASQNDETAGKRGRGRPRKYPPQGQQVDGTDMEDDDSPIDAGTEGDVIQNDAAPDDAGPDGAVSDDGETADATGLEKVHPASAQDIAIIYQGMQILGEIVRSQNETQQKFLQAQTEFSNSVMDRMDTYRMEFARLQSEVAEKEKNRLRADYLTAQDKADQVSEENRQLRAQLDATGKKLIRMNARVESVESENETLHRKLSRRGEAGIPKEDEIDDMRIPEEGNDSGREIVDGQPESTKRELRGSASGSPGSAGASHASGQGRDTAQRREPDRLGWRERRRQKKLQKAREKFLKKVDRDARFSDEQVDLIHEAEKSGIPLEKLELMADPNTTAEKMQALFQCLTGR